VRHGKRSPCLFPQECPQRFPQRGSPKGVPDGGPQTGVPTSSSDLGPLTIVPRGFSHRGVSLRGCSHRGCSPGVGSPRVGPYRGGPQRSWFPSEGGLLLEDSPTRQFASGVSRRVCSPPSVFPRGVPPRVVHLSCVSRAESSEVGSPEVVLDGCPLRRVPYGGPPWGLPPTGSPNVGPQWGPQALSPTVCPNARPKGVPKGAPNLVRRAESPEGVLQIRFLQIGSPRGVPQWAPFSILYLFLPVAVPLYSLRLFPRGFPYFCPSVFPQVVHPDWFPPVQFPQGHPPYIPECFSRCGFSLGCPLGCFPQEVPEGGHPKQVPLVVP
jgi:hypothetical protein